MGVGGIGHHGGPSYGHEHHFLIEPELFFNSPARSNPASRINQYENE
jgi:hypothetical protein